MKRSPIAQFLRSSDETGYWRCFYRESTGIHGSKSIVSRGKVNKSEFDPWHCIASLLSALHTCTHSKGKTHDNRLTTSMY